MRVTKQKLLISPHNKDFCLNCGLGCDEATIVSSRQPICIFVWNLGKSASSRNETKIIFHLLTSSQQQQKVSWD